MANMAVSRIKREFKEVINSEEVGTQGTIVFLSMCIVMIERSKCLYCVCPSKDWQFLFFGYDPLLILCANLLTDKIISLTKQKIT